MTRMTARNGFRRAGSILLSALALLTGCASSGDVEQARQEEAQARAKMRAELQQERALASSMEQESEARKAEAEKLAKALGGKAGGETVASSGPCPANTKSGQLAVQVVNDSHLDDGQVYLLLSAAGSTIGWPSGPPKNLAYYDSTTSTSVTAGALGSLTPCGSITSPYTGRSRPVYQFAVSAITGGRLMVSYNQAVAISDGNFPTGTESFRWDKMEFGYPNSGADLTSMDFFGIPMQFDYLDSSNNVLNTMTYYTSTSTILNQLYGLNTATMTQAFQALGSTKAGTWTPGQGIKKFARAWGPSLLASNSSTGSPTPYPSFGAYLDSLVGRKFTVSGAGNAGCAYSVPYTYQVSFASDGKKGYTVTLTGKTTTGQGPPCGIPPGATTAQGTAVISGGAVSAVTITNPGSDYFSGPPTVTFSGGGGTGAQGTAVLSSSGTVASVTMANKGSGYTSAPTVTFSAPPTPPTSVSLPANLTVTVNLPAPTANGGYDVNLYGAPATAFSVPTAGMTPQQISAVPNSLYAVIAGDFMAGINFGYVGPGSNAPQNSANWYSNPPTLYPFAGTRKTNDGYYNPYAAVFYNLSDAYGFAYSDRGGRPSPYVPLPGDATTMRITILNDNRLDAPQVTVSNPTSSSLTISWPAVSGATGYAVTVSYGGDIPVPGVTLTPATPSPSGTTISGLSAGTTYQISVTATGTLSGNPVSSYTVPIYGTTTGTMAQPGGTLQFGTSLNWSVNASGCPPVNYTFTINQQSYTPSGPGPCSNTKPYPTINGSLGTNVYGLTITDGSNTIYQGEYVVNLTQTAGQYYLNAAFLTPPNSNLLTPGWNAGKAPPYPGGPISPIQSLVIGTPFAPVPTKRAAPVVFPTP